MSDSVILTDEQKKTFDLFLEGKSFFMTGPAGSGKSFLIKHISKWCDENNKKIAVTACTGVAASLIKGQTIHKWGGLGLAQEDSDSLIAKLLKPRSIDAKRRWLKTEVLVIDEISMVSIELFNKLNKLAMALRKNKDFFGGLQVIFCGDFAQLPPVKGNDRYCFESTAWKDNLTDNTIYFETVIRQSDPIFQKILSEIRLGKITNEAKGILNGRIVKDESQAEIHIEGHDEKIIATNLYPHRVDVDKLNQSKFEELIKKGAVHKTFVSTDVIVKKGKVLPTSKKQSEYMDKSMNMSESLKLCIGAQVMLTMNLDVEEGLVNGSRGVVIAFSDTSETVTVVFDNGVETDIGVEKMEIESGKEILRRSQIPLTYAWALTIHKCQGSTLTLVIADLRRTFDYSMLYVTISRVKTLEGLHLLGIKYNGKLCHPVVKKYYATLKNL